MEYDQELYEKSLYYRHVVDETNEIDRHKWLESEKCGSDIGRDKAQWSWISSHKNKWHSNWISKNLKHLSDKTE